MLVVMSTPELVLLQAQVAYEADFITPDSDLGSGFMAHMLERFLQDDVASLYSNDTPTVSSSDVFNPVEPDEKHWVVSEDSDINDDFGSGIRLRTGNMHWLLGGPVAMVNIMKFIRENGITDGSCRFRITYSIKGLRNLPPIKFLFLLDELKQIEPWEKFGAYQRKSHMEHMAACIRTNLYWQDKQRWFNEATHTIECGPQYAIDFSDLPSDRLHIDIVQGPHYEHRTNYIVELMTSTGEALRDSFAFTTTHTDRASSFWDRYAQDINKDAMLFPPDST